ncbi:hypothetical protein [Aridibaculum aurantiacum]|uniref:hypothetical protein n=1 Tax=Aridibaculum aurantiacum TaxID=2810307 RepID=UPI001A97D2DB|nr:hypothetical protein [Aridibaculum aurantiacum]
MQDLIETWKRGKDSIVAGSSSKELVAIAKEKKRNVLYAHYGTVFILTITLIGLALFFYYVAPFKNALSKVGVYMMLGGLMVRILIEIISMVKSGAVQFSQNAEKATSAALSFYNFRKQVHGPVTIGIIGIYVLGFYFLTPEFSQYITLYWMIAMHVSFIVIGIILTVVIRNGIKREMANLLHLSNLRKEITSEQAERGSNVE